MLGKANLVFGFVYLSPHILVGKESACNAGYVGSIPGSEISPGEGNGNPFQYSCLENPMDRGAWQDTVHRVAESDMTALSFFLFVPNNFGASFRQNFFFFKYFFNVCHF